MTTTFTTDWLASRPVFYNTRTGKMSDNVNHVIDLSNVDFHPEGFNNYLDFGYSVFGQTPLRDVKFLPPCATVGTDSAGKIVVGKTPDPIATREVHRLDEHEILDRLEAMVGEWEARTQGTIILPLSGGFDSRLLALMLRDPARVRAYTYGISQDQARSYEVVYARHLAERLGIRWEHVALGGFHRYLDEWDSLYGISTHAHGMYHLEFFGEVARRAGSDLPMLSGIVGDAWAGSIEPMVLRGPRDLPKLGYSHGLHASSRHSRFSDRGELREQFWEEHREAITGPFQVVWVIRLKLILLSSLYRVPEHLGFRPWSPLLDSELALAMVALPPERRKRRRWQRDYFRRRGSDLEGMRLPSDRGNTLDLQGLDRLPPAPLDVRLLSEVVAPEYVERVNAIALGGPKLRRRLARAAHGSIAAASRLLRPIWKAAPGVPDERLAAYNAYMTLRPIESLLRKRGAR